MEICVHGIAESYTDPPRSTECAGNAKLALGDRLALGPGHESRITGSWRMLRVSGLRSHSRLGCRYRDSRFVTYRQAMAGIWRDSEIPSFALLTCDPNRLVSAVNPRTMPVILHREDHDAWLRESWKTAHRLITPFPSQLMAVQQKSARPA